MTKGGDSYLCLHSKWQCLMSHGGRRGAEMGGGGAGWKPELATFLSPEAHTKLLNITKNPEGSGKQLIPF